MISQENWLSLSFQIPEQETPDYEKVGYKLLSDCSNPITGHTNDSNGDYDYTITNLTIELVEIDNNNPSNKYKYSISYDYNLSIANGNRHQLFVFLDGTYSNCHNTYDKSAEIGTYNHSFSSSVPYVRITDFSATVD